MANYLQRVAASAGRRAAVAKPPVSGPPVLPAGRDFAMGPAGSFAMPEEQFVETLQTGTPARTEQRAEMPAAPKLETASKPNAASHETLAAPVEPKPRPRPAQERLSSESPFTVQVPRTLRPSATPNVPPIPASEPPRERPRVRASTTVRPEEFTRGDAPAPPVHRVDSDVKESTISEADIPALPKRPTPPVANIEEQHQAPEPVHTETASSDTTPIPRVDRVDGPARFPAHAAEPSPPPAPPVHLPPVAGNATRQEQSRVSIGSLEVLVNNHPRVPAARPAPASSRNERLNLEKRYLDRFRLRH
jgi:hypothetical protein